MLGGKLDQLRGPRTTIAAPFCHTMTPQIDKVSDVYPCPCPFEMSWSDRECWTPNIDDSGMHLSNNDEYY
jgi:hypothetical protein